ncbi:mCG144702, partial [Mus musculus]
EKLGPLLTNCSTLKPCKFSNIQGGDQIHLPLRTRPQGGGFRLSTRTSLLSSVSEVCDVFSNKAYPPVFGD